MITKQLENIIEKYKITETDNICYKYTNAKRCNTNTLENIYKI